MDQRIFVYIAKVPYSAITIKELLPETPGEGILIKSFSSINDFNIFAGSQNLTDEEKALIFFFEIQEESSCLYSEMIDLEKSFPRSVKIVSASQDTIRKIPVELLKQENYFFHSLNGNDEPYRGLQPLLKIILRNLDLEEQTKNSEQKFHQELEIAKAKINELIETIQVKEKFISLLSHDLKDPLLAMREITSVMLSQWDSFSVSEKQEIISEIHHSSSKAYSLVENISGWSKKTASLSNIVPGQINISEILSQSIEIADSVASLKTIRIENEVDKAIMVSVDENMIFTVFRNLLLNAVKFTPNGGHIKISAEKKGGSYEFCIADNGKGVKNPCVIELFKPGHTIFSPPGEKNGNGHGIGLIICKEFIERNGGQIWLESKSGIGSQFYFTIPASV